MDQRMITTTTKIKFTISLLTAMDLPPTRFGYRSKLFSFCYCIEGPKLTEAENSHALPHPVPSLPLRHRQDLNSQTAVVMSRPPPQPGISEMVSQIGPEQQGRLGPPLETLPLLYLRV